MQRCRPVAVLAALVGLLGLTGAAAASSRSSAPVPDAASLGLEPADLPGMVLVQRAPLTEAGQTFQLTLLASAAKSGRSLAESIVMFADSSEAAAATVSGIRGAVQTSAGRTELGRAFTSEAAALLKSPAIRSRFGLKGKPSSASLKVTVGEASAPAANVVALPINAKSGSGGFRMVIAYLQVDRTVGTVALIRFGSQALGVRALAPLLTAEQKRIRGAFTVANTALPTLTGGVGQAQVLTADAGSWLGGPSSFTYSWQQCDGTGAGCTPIAGATASTYTPVSANSGSTLRVAVTGTNSVNSQEAISAQTTAIP
jgi:hypothetical protein